MRARFGPLAGSDRVTVAVCPAFTAITFWAHVAGVRAGDTSTIRWMRRSGDTLVAYFVYTFLVPTAFGLLADNQQWFKDLQPWIDMQFAQSGLFIFQTSLTGEEWAQIGVSSFIWLVLPLLVGLRLVMRAEVK